MTLYKIKIFTLCYLFPPQKKPTTKKPKGDGALPAAKFYGPVEPAAALRSIKEAAKESGKPTLKQDFTHSNQANPEKSTPAASRQNGKKCTAQFGCNNFAAFSEKSGTLYCRNHKPKHIPVTSIHESESKVAGKKKNS